MLEGIVIRAFVVALSAAVASAASAQSVTTFYDPSGGIVERVHQGTVGDTRWAYTTSNGQWSSAQGAGNVARATVGRNVAIDASRGATVAGKVPVLLASEFTAAAVAGAAIKVARLSIAGLVVGAALDLALRQAHLAFDATQQSMIYNPDVVFPNGPGYWTTDISCAANTHYSTGEDALAGAASCLTVQQTPYRFRPGSVSGSGPYYGSLYRQDPASSYPPYALPPEQLLANATALTLHPGPPGNVPTCPNGVQFNNTTMCKQAVLDTTAVTYLTPHIDRTNGPSIGQNVTGNTGVQFQPDSGVVPSGNPIDVDAGSWPQASGPATQSFGPQTSTTTATDTSTNAQGSPQSFTTTTTTTNTTNVSNTYNNATSVTNVTNQTQVRTCDAAGVCTNRSTSNSGDAQSTAPADSTKPCGLPGAPPCKIDETGTPTPADGVTALKPGQTALDQAKQDSLDQITGAKATDAKDTSWHFSFAFPTACSPLQAWSGMSFDICRFKPVIHDLLSMLWYGSTLFAVLAMFSKTMHGGA